MKLQAKDLMVDDWVYIKDYPIKSQPQKVKPEHFVRSLVEFEPILINKEILEKNGFVEDDNDDCWGDANCFFIPNYVDKNIISWETHIEPTNGRGDFNGNLTYVHEFQHALKLCGIEKEITL